MIEMKMFKIYGLAGAVAVLLTAAACSDKFEEAAGVDGGQTTGKTFNVSVGADSGSTATRAEYDGATYRWSPGDRVGFYMVPAGGGAPIVSNARFTGTNVAAAATADFEGELSEASLSQVSSSSAYDYYSYFPYNANAGGAGFPNVAFTIPNSITLTPDVFPVEYGFMVGGRQTSSASEKPVSWLEGGEQKLGKHIGFSYKHVFAYLQVYLKLNLMTQDINRIVVTCTDGDAMSGTAHVNIETGAMTFVASSNSITVNIAGGLNVDEDPGKGYIWIPVNPALAGKTFKLEFYTVGGNMIDQTITGGDLRPGMKHKAGFRLPFHMSFGSLNSAGVSNNTFSYLGYMFGCSSSYFSTGGDYVELSAYFLASSKDSDRGSLRSPALNLTNTDGLSSIPVKLSVDANGGVDPNSTDRSLQSQAVSSSTITIPKNNAVTVPYNEYGVVTAPNKLYLTSSTPCIGMRSSTWGLYAIWIREIWIEPAY